jgi:Skp family chaperone for outer membrane proteins
MRFEKLGVAVFAGVLLSASGLAQQAESPTKIAFVHVQRALISTEEGKIRLKELDDWLRPREDELARLGKEVNNLKGEIVTRQGGAPDNTLVELNRRLVATQREFEDKQRISKRDFEAKQQALRIDLGGKLQEVITKYADANRYTAVFFLNPTEIAYLAESADITETVIKLYNEKYPVAAKAPAAPAK